MPMLMQGGYGVAAYPTVAAAGPSSAVSIFRPGEKVQVWSNTKGTWMDGVVQQVFVVPTLAEGFSVAAGTVKVVSGAGVKWVAPESIATMLRKVVHVAPAVNPAAEMPLPEVAAERAPFAVHIQAPLPTPFAAPGQEPRQEPRQEHRETAQPPCKNGCGRAVQPGLTRGLKAYDTCCKSCAQKPGSGEHDENCGGRGLSKGSMASGERRAVSEAAARICVRTAIKALLEDQKLLEQQASVAFDTVAGVESGKWLTGKQVFNAFAQLLSSIAGLSSSDVPEHELARLFKSLGVSQESPVTPSKFVDLCEIGLKAKQREWFPEVLPACTRNFVKQNKRSLEAVYTMGEKLGEGSFGVVFRVTHKISGEQRVCKKIEKSSSAMTNEQILAEIGNMALLDHPNVIKVYEYFDSPSYVAQIMEPCNGGELQEKVDVLRNTGKAPYDEAFIRDVMKQTLRALAFMHKMRFMHKDLKPQNIMLVDKGSSSVKIIDFGLAELFNPNQEFSSAVGGTLLYMAPEVFKKQMTVKCDVWSTGVILFNLLTGDYPFLAQWPPPPGKDQNWWQAETTTKIQNEEPRKHAALAKFSPQCIDLMMRMLQKDHQRRPDATQCLEHPWFSTVTEEAPVLSQGLVQCVEAYARMSELKKSVFLLIAHQCVVEALPALRAIFTHFDERNQGSLSSLDLKNLLIRSGLGSLQAERVIHSLDRNADGSITWTEFTAAVICVKACRDLRLVDAAFATFDVDQDGKIVPSDVEAIMVNEEDAAGASAWKARLPALFQDFFQGESRHLGDTLRRGLLSPFKKEVWSQITKEQFRTYMGQKLDFQAGNVLYAVR